MGVRDVGVRARRQVRRERRADAEDSEKGRRWDLNDRNAKTRSCGGVEERQWTQMTRMQFPSVTSVSSP